MPAFVQQAAGTQDTALSLTVTLPANATAGNVVMLSVGYNDQPSTITVSGLGATWTRIYIDTAANSNLNKCGLWKGVGVTGGTATITITASAGGATYFAANAAEFSGVVAIGSATGSTSTGTTATTTAQSLASGDVAYGLLSWTRTATDTYTDSPGAWTSLTIADDVGMGQTVRPAYRVATGSESATRQITLSASKTISKASVALTASTPPPAAAQRSPIVVPHNRAVLRSTVI